MTADNHIHTKFSPDGHGEPEEYVLHAIELGLKHIVFTEHVDLMYYNPQIEHCDLDCYFGTVRELKQKYAGKLYIGAGLEMGYTEQNKDANAELLQKYDPDYVINSVHQVGDYDCYLPQYFEDKTPEGAIVTYLKAVLSSLNAPYNYNAVGHLGYVCRNAPFEADLYQTAPALVDEILKTIIARGKILELNTSVRKIPKPTVPTAPVLMRYAGLGGKKICFSSDSHNYVDLCRRYPDARDLARSAGIKMQTVIEDGKEKEIDF